MKERIGTILVAIGALYILGSVISVISTPEGNYIISMALVVWAFLYGARELISYLLHRNRGI